MLSHLHQTHRDLLLLTLLAAVVFLPCLGSRDLWNPDEPRYAEVSREMLLTGSYLVPHLNGTVYSEKPPLLFWSMAAAATVTGGLNEVAVRLPAALSALLSVLLVYWLGRQLFTRRAAWLAALAFATCRKILWQSQDGQIDMLLTFLVTLAVCCWLYGLQRGRSRYSYLFFLCAGLATLAKGPVGLLPPLLSIITFLLVSGRRSQIRQLHPVTGLLVWTLPVLAWLVPAAFIAGPEYLEIMLFKQNVTRFANPWHHFRPWYYYLGVIIGDFFPWSLFLPATAVLGWRLLRAGRTDSKQEIAASEHAQPPTAQADSPEQRLGERDGFLFALSWAVVTLVFFSLSPAKRTVYILTMYPALALLAGYTLDRLAADWPRSRRWFGWVVGAVAGLMLLATAAVPVLTGKKPELAVLGAAFPTKAMVVLGLLAAAAVASWILLLRGRTMAGLQTLAAGMAALHLGILLLLVPHVEVIKSARPLARVLSEQLQEGQLYAIYPRLDAPFVFYTKRFAVELRTPEQLHDFINQPEQVWLLIERHALRELEQPLPMIEVAADQDLKDGYVLYRSEPGQAAAEDSEVIGGETQGSP